LNPLIIFSYGLTKSGSTLAFQLTRMGCEQAGFDQPQIAVPGLVVSPRINAIEHVSAAQADALLEEVRALGHPMVLKTHTRCDPAVRALVEAGHARVQVVLRDPRDVALSMLDNGRLSRERGRPAFAEIVTLEDAIAALDNQIESLRGWAALPGAQILHYDDLAFDTVATTARILAHLDLPGDPAAIAAAVRSGRFTQLNKGIPHRHRAEMTAADSARFRSHFAAFHDDFLHAAAAGGQARTQGVTP
jgi:sulfotransferase family protein